MSQKIRHDQIRTILIEPHVSEKTTLLNQNSGQIAFKVRSDSNKKQIKRAVEEMFKVKVSSVKTVSVKGKKKRMGMRSGKTNDWKKAYIKLEEGQNLDFMNTEV
ncbi:MAG: 50S ribosomal protein L23 [Gammaproteobacteria bacterium]|jgi:large subunit ribosomal protein L23|nr:50S ribosomal protein L23 [Gammaproteobacteria bacterium]MDG2297220.1 50S ribosomal protein L23 [Gammaproteobacteria bacterium]|tara:strand:+ start:666 stop:977 length:312 start_codon:yes stop_codon:yes gene_type:complete